MKRLALVLLLLAIAGCFCGCAGPREAYVKADRVKFQVIAPRYVGYVLEDPKLDDQEKRSRINSIVTWDERIANEERDLELPVPAPYPGPDFVWPGRDSAEPQP